MIYFIRNNFQYVKIGTTTNISSRFKTIQSCNPERLTVWLTFKGSYKTEARLHQLFEKQRIRNTEWFHINDIIKNFVKEIKDYPEQINVDSCYTSAHRRYLEGKAKRLGANSNIAKAINKFK